MAKWFRSEPMEYITLILNEDAAHACLANIGKMGILQFTDVSFGKRMTSILFVRILRDLFDAYCISHRSIVIRVAL